MDEEVALSLFSLVVIGFPFQLVFSKYYLRRPCFGYGRCKIHESYFFH